MRLRLRFKAAIGVACLIVLSFGGVSYGQLQRLNCKGVDQECLVSEVPVPGVRIVQQQDYPLRPAHYLSSNLYTTLASGRETGNRFVSFDFIVPNLGGPLPHTHHNEWETFYVEQGSVTFTIGVDPNPPYNFVTKEIPAGTLVYGPQGPVHGFVNTSGKGARIFSFAMPAGLENFFHTAGTTVTDFNAPIPPITPDEIIRTAFWAGQRGDALYPPNTPAPIVPPGTPEHVIASINDNTLPTETGPFGEKRVVLLTPAQVGNITGADAFCGPPPIPGRPGGSVKYSYFTMPVGKNIPLPHKSQTTETFYTQGGTLTFVFTDPTNFHQKRVAVGPLTFVQISPGVEFSIANLGGSPGDGDDDGHDNGHDNGHDKKNDQSNVTASSLTVTVVDPPNFPASCGPTIFPPQP